MISFKKASYGKIIRQNKLMFVTYIVVCLYILNLRAISD
ncbi:protein of unknown function [Candidatus Nitrosacidococcus tergens]|uniref:Uncharacterized protein n=1 Tax=Candidatus Nitrosacidococcus tergens TaxID=553981 RepID=A0A7G1QAJ2_9GAMM|nr:protein of unknown function [Candidatus Nitrosacidococcus tergens]